MAIAYFSTWTTYGTWLPGDSRGWFKRAKGGQISSSIREFAATLRMTEDAVTLDQQRRQIVEKTIVDHCIVRGWILHAVNCRTNHVHAVVSAPDRSLRIPRVQFKAWCTRKLMDYDRSLELVRGSSLRENWWTERGWDEYIDNERELADVVAYVCERQTE
jgi:REP element-mobilizing transposase RayT